VILPQLGTTELEASSLTGQDCVALSEELDGEAPWVQGEMSQDHIVRACLLTFRTPDEILARLRPLAAAFGIRLPERVELWLGEITARGRSGLGTEA
jgi:hypothetical protein